MMKPEKIIEWVEASFLDVEIVQKYGETTAFYNKKQALPHGAYFLTIKLCDGPNDKASRLDRPGVYRLSWQLSKGEFYTKFGEKPKRPMKGQAIDSDFNLDDIDVLMPHAVYGWMNWVMIVSPSEESFHKAQASIQSAYLSAKSKFEKKVKTDS